MSKKPVEKVIMAFGTFDGLHPGHLNFFRQARALAAKALLVISVARDRNVLRIKGKRPVLDENKRLTLVKSTGLPDKVVLGGLSNHLAHILKVRPDIIALGYDQRDYVKNLKSDLKKKGLAVRVVRLKSYKAHVYKNALLRPRK
jgi:FAD synthetase